jgi:carboxypeptidase Taq
MNSPEAWTALKVHVREIDTLTGIAGLLGWDQQTYQPPGGASNRGEQLSLLSRLRHERLVDPRVPDWLAAVAQGPVDEVQAAALRNLGRDHARAVKVPGALVERLSEASNRGFGTWIEAKQEHNFAKFAPVLEEILDLTRERAQRVDPSRPPYDVLLEEFDPGTSVESLRVTFARLRDGLAELVKAVGDRPAPPELDLRLDTARQDALFQNVAGTLGYDLQRGRVDHAEHPFSVPIGHGDVRITHHLYEGDLLGGLTGTIHEAGHAMYEQGLPAELAGTSVNAAASFGLHESQSRFWENYIGRSRAFSHWFAGQLKAAAPELSVDGDRLYEASNRVRPGPIRILADEVTYNLHIIVRFEIELALFEDRLRVKDLPEAWNERYRALLGVNPEHDGQGVLQDVHWSGGAFGYFPSYTLGNLYAASFGATLSAAVPDLWDQVAAGDFRAILAWLRANVHQKGHLLEAPEIVAAAVGPRDSVQDLLDHLWSRYGALAGVRRR